MSDTDDDHNKLSYSIFVDKKHASRNDQHSPQLNTVRPCVNSSWIPDDTVTNCHKCSRSFNIYWRKHHCRACGRIFCADCSNKYIILPHDLEIFPDPVVNHSKSSPSSKPKKRIKERVCVGCHGRLEKIYNLQIYILIFTYLDLSDLCSVTTVCKDWNFAVNFCLSLFRDIQYQMNDSHLTVIQKRMLWNNRYNLLGHNRWLAKLITHFGSEPEIERLFVGGNNVAEKHNCWSLMCTRICSNSLTGFDAVELLMNPSANGKRLSPNMRKYLIKCLTSLSDAEYQCLIPVLMLQLQYEDPAQELILFDNLLERCTSIDLATEIYWNLHLFKGKYPRLEIYYKLFLQRISSKNGENFYNELIRGYKFLLSLLDLNQSIADRNPLPVGAFTTARLPLNPNLHVLKVNIDDLKNKVSYSSPLVIPMVCTPNIGSPTESPVKESLIAETIEAPKEKQKKKVNIKETSKSESVDNEQAKKSANEIRKKKNNTFSPLPDVPGATGSSDKYSILPNSKNDMRSLTQSILYKKECLIKDYIILKIIRLMDLLLKKHLNMDFEIVTYRVLPLNEESGFIEIVPNAETLYEIVYKKNISLLNHILDNNKNSSVSEIRERFIRSCAAYAVITYLLGIGDRHLDNIMVTKEGRLFHIDYSFILGHDPKLISPAIRVTQDIIDAMGGLAGTDFGKFRDYCGKIYNILRKYTFLFLSILSLLTEQHLNLENGKYPYAEVRRSVLSRFIPNELSHEASSQLLIKIEESYSAYTPRVFVDLFHHTMKGTLDIKSYMPSFSLFNQK